MYAEAAGYLKHWISMYSLEGPNLYENLKQKQVVKMSDTKESLKFFVVGGKSY